jgi:hypothetical protein
MPWAGLLLVVDVVTRMHPQQLLDFRQRRVVKLQVNIKPRSDQTIIDGAQSIGALRMMRTHVVLPAVAMGNEGGGCHSEGLV